MLNFVIAFAIKQIKKSIGKDILKDKEYFLTLPPNEVKAAMIERVQSKRHFPGEARRVVCGIIREFNADTSLALYELLEKFFK